MKSTFLKWAPVAALAIVMLGGCAALNQFQSKGELRLAGLTKRVTVKRDRQVFPAAGGPGQGQLCRQERQGCIL